VAIEVAGLGGSADLTGKYRFLYWHRPRVSAKLPYHSFGKRSVPLGKGTGGTDGTRGNEKKMFRS